MDPADWPICECTPKKPCGPDTECLNRLLFFECNPNTCWAGDKCGNQRIRKNMQISAQPVKCEGRGWGLKSLQGKFIMIYSNFSSVVTNYLRVDEFYINHPGAKFGPTSMLRYILGLVYRIKYGIVYNCSYYLRNLWLQIVTLCYFTLLKKYYSSYIES